MTPESLDWLRAFCAFGWGLIAYVISGTILFYTWKDARREISAKRKKK